MQDTTQEKVFMKQKYIRTKGVGKAWQEHTFGFNCIYLYMEDLAYQTFLTLWFYIDFQMKMTSFGIMLKQR